MRLKFLAQGNNWSFDFFFERLSPLLCGNRRYINNDGHVICTFWLSLITLGNVNAAGIMCDVPGRKHYTIIFLGHCDFYLDLWPTDFKIRIRRGHLLVLNNSIVIKRNLYVTTYCEHGKKSMSPYEWPGDIMNIWWWGGDSPDDV